MKLLVAGAAAILLGAGCTIADDLPPINGYRQVLVRCGTATMGMCATRAEEECGGPYEVLETDMGFQANSIRVRCLNRPTYVYIYQRLELRADRAGGWLDGRKVAVNGYR